MLYEIQLPQLVDGHLPVAVIALLLGVLACSWLLRKSEPAASEGTLLIPKSVYSRLPLVGHLVGYARNGHSYFSSLCASTPLPIFTIRMAKVKLSVVKPALTRDLPQTKHLSLAPLVLELFKRSLDLGEFSSYLLREDDEQSKRFAPEISRLFRDEFIPNRNLRKYVEELDAYIQRDVALIHDAKSIHIEDWIFKTLVGALGKSMWGGDDGPFGDAEFVAQLRTFLLNIQRLNNPATFMIEPKLLESRRVVRERLDQFSFEKYAEKAGSSESVDESFLARVRTLCLDHGAAAEGWTDYQLLLIAGLGPNVMAASTWMIHHLLADPNLLAAAREQLDNFVRKSEGSIDLADMSEKCPLLIATWNEVLRFHGGFTLGRYVHEDTTLAGTYLLKKGSYALAPLKPHHFDKQLWGDDVEDFRPHGFLKEGGGLDEIQKRKLRVYGLFGALCPGRFLAVHMTMAVTVRLLLAFDIAPLKDGTNHAPPEECKETIAGLATPAWDAEIGLRRREIIEDVEIRFRSSR
ncbi:cytochrome P450 [Diplogelasinospora grovesii]|uniref:Cytochrome P450 n=1 Tax=Diplogelasinospora grovesii TaxID=303347 RepID=A0AAN6NB40_9PEZI|nr:cytochrome P450 [Diplogelasinospora grovesii]